MCVSHVHIIRGSISLAREYDVRDSPKILKLYNPETQYIIHMSTHD